MNRADRIRELVASKPDRFRDVATSRRVVVVFCLVAIVPVALAVNSFRPFVSLPPTVLSILEGVFRVVVYLPVAAIRTILFEPFGLGGLFSIPVLGHLIVFASLLAFYYCLSLLLVTGVTMVRDALESR